MLECWRGAFAEYRPEIRFEGKGWDAETSKGDLSPKDLCPGAIQALHYRPYWQNEEPNMHLYRQASIYQKVPQLQMC